MVARTEALLQSPDATKLGIGSNAVAHPSQSFADLEAAARSELDARREVLREVGEEYAAGHSALVLVNSDLRAGAISLHVEERTDLVWVSAPGEDAVVTEFVTPRRFDFVADATGWALVANEIEGGGPAPVNEGVGLSEGAMRDELAPARAAVERFTLTQGSPSPDAPDPGGGSGKTGPYNYTAMVNYANTYWDNYNSAYRNFAGEEEGGDCTNFISQAMKAGGWEELSGFYRDDNYWWYNFLNQTWTWINVQYWYTFAKVRSGRTTLRSDPYNMVPSDVLQVDWGNDGTKNHTMIVTARNNGVPLLTYHSNDTHNRSLSNLMTANPGARWLPHKT
jgi:hypothetical protein